MSVHITSEHRRRGAELVKEMEHRGGLAPLDVRRFWEDDARANADPWAADCPQVPLGIGMSNECVWAELGIEENWHELMHNDAFRVSLERRYNDRAEQLVGRRLLGESATPPERRWPAVRDLGDIFEATSEWHGWSYWLQRSARTPDELEALLDRVDVRLASLREFLLPPGWEREKARLAGLGVPAPLYRGQRGPVTFAMSIYGVEDLIYLIFDRPDLAKRFSETILQAILGRARVLDEEAGWTAETAPHGWYWCDDNCAMLNAELYDFFAAPILQGVFDRYSPRPGDRRGQHSDSDMAQHLPTLGRLGLTEVNLGPNLTVAEIRRHLPNTLIHGQLAPFTFSRHETVDMVAELIRDYEMAREHKGLVFTTAGSINNGSRLTGLRLLMAAIQRYGRF